MSEEFLLTLILYFIQFIVMNFDWNANWICDYRLESEKVFL